MRPLSLYWHTIRHLRREQIVGRVVQRVRQWRPSPVVLSEPPGVRAPSGAWMLPAATEPSLLGPESFSFLDETRAVASAGDWDRDEWPLLWRYNLHYFDDLNARDADARTGWHRALMRRWVRENPPASGTGWDPYPSSRRIVNWVKWLCRQGACHGARNAAPPDEIASSLPLQVRQLVGRLEYHLLGNHLFANAKALVFAGLYYEGDEASRWLELGFRILSREIAEQFLPDGGHFERSPMYHALALEDMLDLQNICNRHGDAVPSAWRPLTATWPGLIARMRCWLRVMSHPDGDFAFFNDAAFGIAPSSGELEGYASRLGLGPAPAPAEGVTHLRDSGYIRLQLDGSVALLDCAPIGPDYIPGHAHADTLSFEWSARGRRILVNSGTSCYGSSAQRQFERSTAAHNTVEVDGESSSEVWGGFRVARRAYPRDVEVVQSPDGACTVRASHDGYRRLPGRVMHTRTWRFEPRGLTVEDRLDGAHERAVSRFHVHPEVEIAEATGESGTLSAGAARLAGYRVALGRGGWQASRYHPRFGLSMPNRCLVVALDRGVSRLELSL